MTNLLLRTAPRPANHIDDKVNGETVDEDQQLVETALLSDLRPVLQRQTLAASG